ncbi:hypothetical protein Q7P37_003778 [Cladosporium fusiforme]
MDLPTAGHEGDQSGQAATSSPGHYAFLNHSSSTLPNNLPPKVDNKPLARQKRKRTSAEDQTILEDAYKRDPKPDKAARQELVKKVALGEKEVQIWFQNRRQSSRRKARPLLPHEVAQYQASRAGASTSFSASFEPPQPNFGSDDSNATIPDETLSDNQHHSTPPPPSSLPNPMFDERQGARSGQHAETPTVGYPALTAYHALQSDRHGRQSLPSSASYGYLANKRRASSFRDDREPVEYLHSREQTNDTDAKPRLKKSSSFVRLSMTSEGAAKVITKDSSSPSPPRPSQQVEHSFSMNQGSGVSSLDLTRTKRESAVGSLRRSVSGRSRDSRAWEFWCDKDSRAEAEQKAEQDATGSAADAIGLMRANSGRRVLGSLPAKRNATVTREPTAKRTKYDHSRPSLQRSSTSAGRLQHGVETLKPALKLKYSESGASIHIPGNESDKENWSPERSLMPSSQPAMGSRGGQHHRQGRAVLGESRAAGNTGRAARTDKRPPQTPRQRAATDKVTDPDQDPELVAFMRDRKSSSISGEEELDCVQGLLSLSQASAGEAEAMEGNLNTPYHLQSADGHSRIIQDLRRRTDHSHQDIRPMNMLRTTMSTSKHVSVGIVGAGFAGLRCADVLLQHGVKVTIFEARNRVGGRVGQSWHLGHPVDLGPNWIHGTDDNPIMQLARETDTKLHAWDEEQSVIDSSGKPLSSEEAEEYGRLLWDDGLIGAAFKYSNEHGQSIPASRSLYDFFEEKAKELFTDLAPVKAGRKREQLLKSVGSPVQRQSLKFFWLEECIEGENPFVAGTYEKILNAMAKAAREKADIRFNNKVVRVRSGKSESDERTKPSIETADGGFLEFDEVVCTMPLGWLQRNQSAFEPPLEPRLTKAISSIGYGTLDKVYITFPSAFWDTPVTSSPNTTRLDAEGKTPNVTATSKPLHQPGNGNTAKASQHYPGFTHWLAPAYAPDTNPDAWDQQGANLAALPGDTAHPTLLFYVYGPCAEHIASLAKTTTAPKKRDAALISWFEPYFSRLPNYNASSPECQPSGILATAWANDEFAGYGSYANFQVGLEEGDRDIEVMRHGMPERGVWIAGEHTAPFVALGTSTGAYWAGEGVGQRIAKAYGLQAQGAI